MSIDPLAVRDALASYERAPGGDTYGQFVSAAEPPRQELIRRLNRVPGATGRLVRMRADLLRLIPYERVGDPMDIGHVAVWLASDASDYLTGTTNYADGGMTLYPGFREGDL